MKRIQLLTRVEPDLRDRVSQMASEEGISINDLVIKALESYLGIPQDRSDNTIDNSTAITSLEERITALESNAIKVDNSTAITSLEERITALESNAIKVDNSTAITMDIDDRFEALESEIKEIREELKAIVDAGKLPQKTAPKKQKTIAPGGTIGEQILKLMGDGNDWSNKELLSHFPGKKLGTITGELSRLCKKGAIVKVKSESGKEIPGVHRIKT